MEKGVLKLADFFFFFFFQRGIILGFLCKFGFVTREFLLVQEQGSDNSHTCNGLGAKKEPKKPKVGICLAVVCPRIVRKESLAAIPAEIPAQCGPSLVRMEKFGISLLSRGWGNVWVEKGMVTIAQWGQKKAHSGSGCLFFYYFFPGDFLWFCPHHTRCRLFSSVLKHTHLLIIIFKQACVVSAPPNT